MSDTDANAGSTQDPNTDKTDGDQQQQDKNNAPNNDDNMADLWQDPVDETKKPQQTQQSQNIQQQQVDSGAVFDKHIAGLKLTDGIDLTEISNDLNQGNTGSLEKVFEKLTANVYRQSMMDASRIIDKKVQEGVDKAIQQSTNAVHGNMAVDRMQAAMPFTKDPAISPVASAVLSQLIKKGKSVEDAVIGVRKFFQNTAKISAKELGIKRPPSARPGGQQFNNNSVDDDDDTEIDWMDTLNV